MLQYERIDVSEGIGLNKSEKSKECIFCHYWYWYFINMNHIFVMDVMIYQ